MVSAVATHFYPYFIFVLAALILSLNGSSASDRNRSCRYIPCDANSTKITYPFWAKTQHSDCLRRPGFELFCEGNQTAIHLPSGKFYISEIRYSSKKLIVTDPDQCLHKMIMKLNLSWSPFYLPPLSTINATYLNCSKDLEGNYTRDFKRVDCLKESGRFVFKANSTLSVGKYPRNTCETIGTFQLSTDFYQCDPISNRCFFNNSTHADDRLYLNWNLDEGSSTKNKRNKRIILGVSIGGGIFISITFALTFYVCHKTNTDSRRRVQLRINQILKDYRAHMLNRYSYAALKKMTNKFSLQIGKGGYCTVYKGKNPNGLPVAVKMLENSMGNGQEFINEIVTIGTIHHVNVVRLLGFCSEGSKRALIYEFMPNGSLEKFISSQDATIHELLGWKRLLDIVIGIAQGIEYLHHGCNQRILHLDIKPHNILLDCNFNPKISDFGLAKICLKERSNVGTTTTRGTMGYIAPELFSRAFGVVSNKSDVYSFGMLVLEMVGGNKENHDSLEMQGQASFPESIYDRVTKAKGSDEENEVARKLTIVALWCIQWNPNDRPSMKRVVKMLEGSIECLKLPPKPNVSSSHSST